MFYLIKTRCIVEKFDMSNLYENTYTLKYSPMAQLSNVEPLFFVSGIDPPLPQEKYKGTDNVARSFAFFIKNQRK